MSFPRVSIQALSIIVFGACAAVLADAPGESPARGALSPHRFYLRLNRDEFSLLHAAAADGVKKYSGSADFRVRIQSTADGLIWTVHVENNKMLEVWGFWMVEKTAEFVSRLEIDEITKEERAALQVVQSVNAKIKHARANPVWDVVRLSGTVENDGPGSFIVSPNGKYKVGGSQLSEIRKQEGATVRVTGSFKVPGEIDIERFIKCEKNTLEVFVMSLCPYTRQALPAIIRYLRTYSGEDPPDLAVRYIYYYERETRSGPAFSSLQGEAEITENLVQMVIRDQHPKFYFDYVLTRASDQTSPWDDLAKKVGLSRGDRAAIAAQIHVDRLELILKEFEYVAGSHGILDGSPSFVWEGHRVASLHEIPAFKGLEPFRPGQCDER